MNSARLRVDNWVRGLGVYCFPLRSGFPPEKCVPTLLISFPPVCDNRKDPCGIMESSPPASGGPTEQLLHRCVHETETFERLLPSVA